MVLVMSRKTSVVVRRPWQEVVHGHELLLGNSENSEISSALWDDVGNLCLTQVSC